MLRRFPRLELSYDKVVHKKVSGPPPREDPSHPGAPSDLYAVVPKGDRAWLWFTYTGRKNACFVVKGRDLTMYTTCFADELALGTILPGTLFKVNGHTHFASHDIAHYEGRDVTNEPFERRLAMLRKMFQTQVKWTPLCRGLIIGVTVLTKSFEEAQCHAGAVPYLVYGIRTIRPDGTSKGHLLSKQNARREAVFNVRADIRSDIYHLYYAGDRGEPLIAAVPSYKRSVALNSIFRHIKENENLDALEESDEEAEFEDVREERHVDLQKSALMRCVYHKRFNKWEPVAIVKGQRAKVATAAEVR